MYTPTIFLTVLTPSGNVSRAAMTKVRQHCTNKGYIVTQTSGNGLTLIINDYLYVTLCKADGRDLEGCLTALDIAVLDLNAQQGILASPPAVVYVNDSVAAVDTIVNAEALPLYESDPQMISRSFKHDVESFLMSGDSKTVIGGITLIREGSEIRTRYRIVSHSVDTLEAEAKYCHDATIMHAEWDYVWRADSDLADFMYFYWDESQVEAIYWYVNCMATVSYPQTDVLTLDLFDYFN